MMVFMTLNNSPETSLDLLSKELEDFCTNSSIEQISNESRQRFLDSATQAVLKLLPALSEGTSTEGEKINDDVINELVGGLYIRYGDVFWDKEQQSFSFKHRMAPPIKVESDCLRVTEILNSGLPISTFDDPAYSVNTVPSDSDFDAMTEFFAHCTNGDVLFEHNAPGLDREDIETILEKYQG